MNAIPYEDLKRVNARFYPAFEKAFKEVMESGWYILGKQVAEFEKEFAAYHGVPHCAGLASGLDALTLALNAFDLPKGSEVIVPSNTYIATILSILANGLRPVLVEPDPATYNIDPAKIRAKITGKTRAMIIVHLYGKSCEMDPILEICREYGLRLVEDCAQSHGATYKGQKTGTFGDFGAFSFYPTKNLGALGDGGAILAKDPALHDRILYLRNYGSKIKYHNEYVGVNSRLDEVQAAFLRVKLAALDEINRHKQSLAEIYFARLDPAWKLPQRHRDFVDAHHIFPIRSADREKLRAFLKDRGIATEVHYPIAPHRQVAMRGILDGESYPISESIHASVLSLPISYGHTASEIEAVCEALSAFPSIFRG